MILARKIDKNFDFENGLNFGKLKLKSRKNWLDGMNFDPKRNNMAV